MKIHLNAIKRIIPFHITDHALWPIHWHTLHSLKWPSVFKRTMNAQWFEVTKNRNMWITCYNLELRYITFYIKRSKFCKTLK